MISIEKRYIQTSTGFESNKDSNGNSSANIEIEDFIKPEIICYLVNKILKEKSLKILTPTDIKTVVQQIKQPAFQNSGILSLLENKKNELNPKQGQELIISGAGVKGGMAKLFTKLDHNIIDMIGDINDDDNTTIVKFLKELAGL